MINKKKTNDLVRKVFREIYEKKALIKIIITARALGKSFNKAIDMLDKITSGNKYTAIWLRRNFGDILASVAPFWKQIIDWYVQEKNEKHGTKLETDDFKVIGRGVDYLEKRRIFFFELYKPEKARGAFSNNVNEIVFDEAIPENGLFLENEEKLYSEFLSSVYRDDKQQPPTCYFLANPYSKGAWFLKKIHGDLDELMSEQEKIWEQNEVLFYNSGNNDPRELMNKFESKYDERSGLFPKSADKWILEKLPTQYKELFAMKNCQVIFCRFKFPYGRKNIYMFRYVDRTEKLDPALPHICFEPEEWSHSPQEIKVKGNKRYWKDTLLRMLVFGNLYFGAKEKLNSYEAKSTILALLYEDSKNKTY